MTQTRTFAPTRLPDGAEPYVPGDVERAAALAKEMRERQRRMPPTGQETSSLERGRDMAPEWSSDPVSGGRPMYIVSLPPPDPAQNPKRIIPSAIPDLRDMLRSSESVSLNHKETVACYFCAVHEAQRGPLCEKERREGKTLRVVCGSLGLGKRRGSIRFEWGGSGARPYTRVSEFLNCYDRVLHCWDWHVWVEEEGTDRVFDTLPLDFLRQACVTRGTEPLKAFKKFGIGDKHLVVPGVERDKLAQTGLFLVPAPNGVQRELFRLATLLYGDYLADVSLAPPT